MNPDTVGSHLDWHRLCMAELADLFLRDIADISFSDCNCKYFAKVTMRDFSDDPDAVSLESLAFTLAIAQNITQNLKKNLEPNKIQVGSLQQDFKTYYHKLCPDAPMLPVVDITLFMKQVTDFVNYAGYSIDSTQHILFVPENIFKVFLDEVEV
jgi:hypothetical protein